MQPCNANNPVLVAKAKAAKREAMATAETEDEYLEILEGHWSEWMEPCACPVCK